MKKEQYSAENLNDFWGIIKPYILFDLFFVPIWLLMALPELDVRGKFDIFDFSTYSISIFDNSSIKFVIVVAILLKCVSHILLLMEKIAETLQYNRTYNWFINYVTVVSTVIVLSFAIDYYLLYKISNRTWTNGSSNSEIEFFEFVYYSFMTYTTVGYGELKAIGKFDKVVTMIESLMSLSVFVFILSGFEGIKSSLKITSPFAVNNPPPPSDGDSQTECDSQND